MRVILLGEHLLAALGQVVAGLVVALHNEELQPRTAIARCGCRGNEEAAGESGGRPGLRYGEHERNAAGET